MKSYGLVGGCSTGQRRSRKNFAVTWSSRPCERYSNLEYRDFSAVKCRPHGPEDRVTAEPNFVIRIFWGFYLTTGPWSHSQPETADSCSINSTGQPISPTMTFPRYRRASGLAKPAFSATNVTVQCA